MICLPAWRTPRPQIDTAIRDANHVTMTRTQIQLPEDVFAQPPKPRRLGWKGLTEAEIKRQAQLTSNKLSMVRRRKK